MTNDPEAGREMLDKLKRALKDPKFTSRFKAAPTAALREAGIEVPMGERQDFDNVNKRATEDPAYRLRLKTEPIAVLRDAGIEVPAGVEVRVREFDPNCRYLFLPPPIPLRDKGEK
jgi:nitrile hydratase alpha subunit